MVKRNRRGKERIRDESAENNSVVNPSSLGFFSVWETLFLPLLFQTHHMLVIFQIFVPSFSVLLVICVQKFSHLI
jgi:hypothetical protein